MNPDTFAIQLPRLMAAFAVIILLAACSDSRLPSGLLVSSGTYPSPDDRYRLFVSNNNGLIYYTINETKTGKQLASAGGFSNSQRWFFFWGEQNRLWSYNSDMGPLGVWMKGDRDAWMMTEVDASSPLLGSMPEPVYDYLPNVIKARLRIQNGLSKEAS